MEAASLFTLGYAASAGGYKNETDMIPFERLASQFADPVDAAKFPQPVLRWRNQRWAEGTGLGGLDDAAWREHFTRFAPLPGNLPRPLAMRYHGHQFGTYNPDLGDGRGFLFAQVRDTDGRLLDLGTKGSGQTPWSRRGDGRLTLKGGCAKSWPPAIWKPSASTPRRPSA